MGSVAIVHAAFGPPERSAVVRMLGAAAHRGPAQELVALGRTVLGVSYDAELPIASVAAAPGAIAAVCGRVDNRGALCDALGLGRGRPVGDAQIVLAAFRAWGDDAPRRFRGNVSGAFSDGVTLRCFRDHFGWRPLFHRSQSDGFYAATEVKQVVAGTGIAREPDMDHLGLVLFGGLDTTTAVRGVARVPRASVATVGPDGRATFRAYWRPVDHVETLNVSGDEAVEGLVEVFDRAVARMLTGSDVLLLSGGLDSTAIASCTVRHAGVRYLTGIYPDHPSVDESGWTRMVAEHLGVGLDTFRPGAGTLDHVETWVDRLDGPVDGVSIPEAAQAYREARALGARNVLNGEIAEQLFESRRFALDHLVARRRFGALRTDLRARRAEGTSWWKIARLLAAAATPAPLLHRYGRRVVARTGLRGVPHWLDHGRAAAAGRTDRPLLRLAASDRYAAFQVAAFEGSGMGLEMDEICAAWCGVESRRPFADVDLWEYVLGLPAQVRYAERTSKPLLRTAVRGRLPDAVVDRTDKTYFDEFHLDHADYAKLRDLLVEPDERVPGVDYGALAERLEGGRMGVQELQWARDLARIHAFIGVTRGHSGAKRSSLKAAGSCVWIS